MTENKDMTVPYDGNFVAHIAEELEVHQDEVEEMLTSGKARSPLVVTDDDASGKEALEELRKQEWVRGAQQMSRVYPNSKD